MSYHIHILQKKNSWNRDIYKFDLCGTVGLNLTIKSEDKNIPLDGKVLIVKSELDSMQFAIGEDGVLKIPIEIDENYYLKYQNNCLPNNIFEKSFETFCSDTTTVIMNLSFQLKAKKRKSISHIPSLPQWDQTNLGFKGCLLFH